MSLLRRSPEQNRMVALACLATAAAISVINIAFTRQYFSEQFGSKTPLTEIGAWSLSLMIALFESALTGLILSPDEIGHTFQAPKVNLPSSFPAWIPSAIKAGLIFLGITIVFWVYRLDWISTSEALDIKNGEANAFACFILVFGSEVLSVCFHAVWGVSKVGRVNTFQFWKAINSEIDKMNSQKPENTSQPQQQQASTEQPKKTRGKVSDRLRRQMQGTK